MPRGSDFTARWSEGAWAELKIIDAINSITDLIAVQYGITDGEAFWSTRDMAARNLPDQSQHGKRPDILVFDRSEITPEELAIVENVYGLDDAACEAVVRKAKFAIESEFSPYNYAHRLEQYGKGLSFTIKDEDLLPILRWKAHFGVEVGIVQIFLDSAFILTAQSLEDGIKDGTIKKTVERSYNKEVYYPPMSRGVVFGKFSRMPTIAAEVILDKYGKYTPFRKTTGGELVLSDESLKLLGKLAD